MADFLAYWKNFLSDYPRDESSFNEEWQTGRKGVWQRIRQNDNLWVIVRGTDRHSNEWRLLQKIVVDKKKRKKSEERPFHLIGYKHKGQKFDIESQRDFASILCKLEFTSRKRITAEGGAIGNAIQSLRSLSEKDHRLLEKYSTKLKRHKTDLGNKTDSSTKDSTESVENKFRKFIKAGGGFGNSKTNKKVEKAAVRAVRKHYNANGWKVQSVEAMNCGYDLLCKKDSQENHVEVKGIQKQLLQFIITARERKIAERDDCSVICVVTSALSKKPKIVFFTGRQFIKRFHLQPLAFFANLKK